jgi:hypothetical protein
VDCGGDVSKSVRESRNESIFFRMDNAVSDVDDDEDDDVDAVIRCENRMTNVTKAVTNRATSDCGTTSIAGSDKCKIDHGNKLHIELANNKGIIVELLLPPLLPLPAKVDVGTADGFAVAFSLFACAVADGDTNIPDAPLSGDRNRFDPMDGGDNAILDKIVAEPRSGDDAAPITPAVDESDD